MRGLLPPRDIAEAAAIAFSAPGHEGKAYTIAGPDVMTGEASASVWSRALGKPIRYVGDDMDRFETEISKHMPPHIAHDLRMMYEIWQREGFIASKEDVEQLAGLLGHAPRSYVQFVDQTTREWGTRSSATA